MTLGLAILLFLAMATLVVLAGTRLAAYGDQIADVTGLGGLFVGTLILAFATSLPEVVTDVTAAATGSPDLAVADLFGSSMANMAILAVVDLRSRGRVWPSVELGHARVAAVAMVLTALAALGINSPPGLVIGGIGVVPVAILALYLSAIAWFRRSPALPRATADPALPALQEPTGWESSETAPSVRSLVIRFGLAALVILIAAPAMTISAESISELTGIAQSSIGVILLAVTTSLPELAASLAAVRIGAHDLAVGNLFGSNAANMAVLVFADAAYTEGPILAAVSPTQTVAALGAILLTALAVAAMVGGTETRIRRLEPDALAVLIVYFLALGAVAVAA